MSNFSWGSVKTINMEEHKFDGKMYIDTPGLADPKLHEISVKAINQALKKYLKMKILLAMTLEVAIVAAFIFHILSIPNKP